MSRPTASSQPNSASPDQRRILWTVLVPLFMSLLSVSIVNVALPAIQQGLGASESALQWVLTGYALSFGVFLVPAGRAGDIFGRGKLFIAGVGLFGAASLVSGLAQDVVTLNVARVFMGLGSGLLNPQTVGLIQQYFRGPALGRAFGLFGSVVGVSVAVGPVLGGFLVDAFSPDLGWRLTFLINVPIAALSIVLAVRALPVDAWKGVAGADASGSEPAGAGKRARRVKQLRALDPVGAIILGFAVLATLAPFVESRRTPWLWLALPVGIALVFAWVRWEARYKRGGDSPMVDLELFANRAFSTGTAIAAVYFLGMTSVWVVVALYVQEGLGGAATMAGVMGLPAALASAVSSNLAGRYVFSHGRALIVAGCITTLVGLFSSVVVVAMVERSGWSAWWLLLTLFLVGAAQGAVISPNQTLALADVPVRFAGSAGGVLQTGQRIGTSIGLAVITAVVFAAVQSAGWSAAFIAGFLTIAACMSVALVIAIVDLRAGPGDSRARSRDKAQV